MALSGKLYTFPENWRAYKILIAAEYSKAKVEVDKNFNFGETNKTQEFLNKFPLGKVPAFESNNGECIFDSNAIALAVSDENLSGKDVISKSKVFQWINFAETELLPPVTQLVFPIMGLMPNDKKTHGSALAGIKKSLSVLNTHLSTRTYLVGERISLADITVVSTLLRLYEHIMDAEFRKPYVHLHRWFDTCIHQKEFMAILGEVKICEKMGEFDHNKFKEVQQKIHGQSEKVQKKKTEKKEVQNPKEKPEKEAPAAAPAAAPKPKDPLAILPAGDFNMDDFKRFYSNNDEDKSVPYFWTKFDKENYSIWYSEYKYNDELAKIFMTCNLVGGMFQRLEKMRNNAFASVCVFGEDGDNAISGIWIWRGHELAFPLCDDWQIDYESYSWRKLDADTDETKRLVDQYLKWTGEDSNGKKFNQGKIFK